MSLQGIETKTDVDNSLENHKNYILAYTLVANTIQVFLRKKSFRHMHLLQIQLKFFNEKNNIHTTAGAYTWTLRRWRIVFFFILPLWIKYCFSASIQDQKYIYLGQSMEYVQKAEV